MMYFIWIPLVILYYAYYAYLSNNLNLNPTTYNVVKLYLIGGVVQLWTFVSVVSTNIIFDSVLYDFIMVMTQLVVLTLLSGQSLNIQHIVGIVFAVIGLILLR